MPKNIRSNRRYTASGWKIFSGVDDNVDAKTHFDKLFELLKGKEELVKELSNKYICEFGIVMYIEEDTTIPFAHFDKIWIEKLAQLGAEVDLDIYNFPK